MKKIKFLKFQLGTAILTLIAVLVSGFFVFGPDLSNVAKALNPDDYDKYNQGVGDLTIGDWDRLDDDFVAKSGDAMSGALTAPTLTADDLTVTNNATLNGAIINADLSVGGNIDVTGRVTSAQTLATDAGDTLATKDYVDSVGGGGGAYVDEAGDEMSGDLDMNGNTVTDLANPPINNTDAATKEYVDSAVAAVGGDVFINWGDDICPQGQLLYNGYVFGKKWDWEDGAGDVLCVQDGDPGASNLNPTDRLWPQGTGQALYMPPGIPAQREVECAVCYVPNAICYDNIGSDSCASGFNPAYTGYIMGGVVNSTPVSANNSSRKCINENFDTNSNGLANNTWGGIWYGTSIIDNSDLGTYFPADVNYVKCSVCCN